jgi:hypothetical protein
MDVVLDGERVVKLKPVFGYLHRNHEKIAEGTTYLGSMPETAAGFSLLLFSGEIGRQHQAERASGTEG